jgi:hypothetical protein
MKQRGYTEGKEQDMVKRTISMLTLTALVNLTFAGCTRTVTVSLYESGELRHNAITGVVLKNGEQENFNERGGQFNAGHEEISGITTHRDTAEFELDELSHVKTIARVSGLAMPCNVPSRYFPGYYKIPKPGKITYVITSDGARHVFDRRGGDINVATRTLTGSDQFDQPYSVAWDDVDLVGVKKPDKVVTGLIILGVAAGLFIGIAALAIHDMEFNIFGDSSSY